MKTPVSACITCGNGGSVLLSAVEEIVDGTRKAGYGSLGASDAGQVFGKEHDDQIRGGCVEDDRRVIFDVVKLAGLVGSGNARGHLRRDFVKPRLLLQKRKPSTVPTDR